MEDQPQNNDNASKNNSGDRKDSAPNIVPNYPDYKDWYADTAQYEAAESNYWRRQNTLTAWALVINGLTLLAAVAELSPNLGDERGSGGSGLSLRSDDLNSVVELYTEDNFRQLVVTAEAIPTFLGGLCELEDHGEGGLV